ncbi:MAG: NADH-quinone oxidoreductase subunit N [Phycisphaerales bacterium]|nr:NADH-quinone oxidoreductase subunit N [Phycisphaerales bacterium]
MPASFYPLINVAGLLPEILLVAAGCAVLLMIGPSRRFVPWTALGAVIGALALLLWGAPHPESGSGMRFTSAADFVRHATLVVGALLVLVAFAQPRDDERGEFFSMVLFSLAGLMLLGGASDLVLLFVALELVGIPTYVLVVLSRHNERSLEAGTKYFYLGAMAAAVTAYGFSFLYGVAGSADLGRVATAVTAALAAPGSVPHALALTGLMLSLAGLFFKIAAVPLHLYIADVYEGAASSVAGLLGFVPKLAGIVAIVKMIEAAGWSADRGALFWTLWLSAALSMTIGNVLALRQHSIKRMLAYSGIAHSGYMLVGLIAAGLYAREGSQVGGLMADGPGAVFYYAVAYGIANLCAFAVLGALRIRGAACETVRDVAGLLRRQPALALILVIAMFTLMGLPPTPGFWGKLSLFGSAWSAAASAPADVQWWIGALVILAVVNSAIGAAYYLRVIAACILYESDEPADAIPAQTPQFGATMAGVLLLIYSFFPNPLLMMSRTATRDLRDPLGFVVEAPAAGQPAPVALSPHEEGRAGVAR